MKKPQPVGTNLPVAAVGRLLIGPTTTSIKDRLTHQMSLLLERSFREMQDTIKVHVVNRGRKFLYIRYLCPDAGKPIERSTGTDNRREAEKIAAKWEGELQEGRYAKPSRMTWAAFREYYSASALPGLSKRTAEAYESTLNIFERASNPQKLSDVTTQRVTTLVTALRTNGRSEATIASYLRHLKAAMRWAKRQGLLSVVPQFDMPKRLKGGKLMRGRPVTGEEFDRMIEATARVVENTAAASWNFYLRGLWLSGLRLSESLTLRWDEGPDAIVVDLEGRRPMLRIPAEAHKAHRDTLLPMTPDFARLLDSIPESERRGRVFRLLDSDGTQMAAERNGVGKILTAIGKAAGVVVDERKRRGKMVRKFASAHDLRRAFGQRWAGKVMPTVLRELMRHADIGTTMKYYVGTNAEATADTLWATEGDTLGYTCQSSEIGGDFNPARDSAKQGPC
jgi:integrase